MRPTDGVADRVGKISQAIGIADQIVQIEQFGGHARLQGRDLAHCQLGQPVGLPQGYLHLRYAES